MFNRPDINVKKSPRDQAERIYWIARTIAVLGTSMIENRESSTYSMHEYGKAPVKVKITYSEQERAAFERIRAELLQSLPNVRQHSSTAPNGVKVLYLTTCKN